jgi:hypothetical protein
VISVASRSGAFAPYPGKLTAQARGGSSMGADAIVTPPVGARSERRTAPREPTKCREARSPGQAEATNWRDTDYPGHTKRINWRDTPTQGHTESNH